MTRVEIIWQLGAEFISLGVLRSFCSNLDYEKHIKKKKHRISQKWIIMCNLMECLLFSVELSNFTY